MPVNSIKEQPVDWEINTFKTDLLKILVMIWLLPSYTSELGVAVNEMIESKPGGSVQ